MIHVADSGPGRSGSDCVWTVCPVTLNGLALLRHDRLATMLAAEWTSVKTSFDILAHELDPSVRHLLGPLAALTFRAWAHGRFTADIQITCADGSILRFTDQDFMGIGLIPATLLTALHGRPLTAYCDHPVFAGVVFDQSDELGAPRSQASSIPVDGHLPDRVAGRRAALLAAHPAPEAAHA